MMIGVGEGEDTTSKEELWECLGVGDILRCLIKMENQVWMSCHVMS